MRDVFELDGVSAADDDDERVVTFETRTGASGRGVVGGDVEVEDEDDDWVWCSGGKLEAGGDAGVSGGSGSCEAICCCSWSSAGAGNDVEDSG